MKYVVLLASLVASNAFAGDYWADHNPNPWAASTAGGEMLENQRNNPQDDSNNNVDSQCLQQCLNHGSIYQYCQKKCSY